MPKKRSKYGNQKTDGYASKREAKYALELELRQKAGEISNLRSQVKYEIIPKQEGERACHYRADFVFTQNGRDVVLDVKGYKTQVFIIKRKLMKLVHGITIEEV